MRLTDLTFAVPSLLLAFLAVKILGDGLRDALDPQGR